MAKSGVRWEKGNPAKMQMAVREKGENFKADALEALDLSVTEGGAALQDNLYAAETKTGRRRAERGGFAGRHNTGNMIASVSAGIRNARAKIVWGWFGWKGGDFEQYFRDQDLGEGNIPAARALHPAYIKARESFRRRMSAIVRGR